jgi:hypothetical protein
VWDSRFQILTGQERASHSGCCLLAKAIESTALALERVDNIHGDDGLAAGVLSVGDGVTDDALEEDFEDVASLIINKAGDTLDPATASQTTNGRLGDSLNVIAQDLAVALGATLSKTLSSFTASGHDACGLGTEITEAVRWMLLSW